MVSSRRLRIFLKVGFFFGFSSYVCPDLSHAHLGGDLASIEADRKSLQALSVTGTTQSNVQAITLLFSVHEMITAGVKVRQYVSPSGSVFGLAWNGPHHPDLSVLLGGYHSEFKKSLESHQERLSKQGRSRGHHGPRSQRLHSENIRISMSGHLRSFRGSAYVPSLLPAGVSPHEIR